MFKSGHGDCDVTSAELAVAEFSNETDQNKPDGTTSDLCI